MYKEKKKSREKKKHVIRHMHSNDAKPSSEKYYLYSIFFFAAAAAPNKQGKYLATHFSQAQRHRLSNLSSFFFWNIEISFRTRDIFFFLVLLGPVSSGVDFLTCTNAYEMLFTRNMRNINARHTNI